MSRYENTIVWRDTVRQVREGEVPLPDSSSKYNECLLTVKLPKVRKRIGRVSVYNADTFDIAKQAIRKGLNPLVLNMANHLQAGGGVANGARAQEECLFRRSNYFATLTDNLYPLKDNEIIYSPKVHVFKDRYYKPSELWHCSCLAVAALRRMRYASDTYNPRERAMMQQKIEMMFQIAIHKGHDSLVLGAFGCGAFNNPPIEVCNLFEEAINKYRHYFKKIFFAVMADYDNPNYDIFRSLEYLN